MGTVFGRRFESAQLHKARYCCYLQMDNPSGETDLGKTYDGLTRKGFRYYKVDLDKDGISAQIDFLSFTQKPEMNPRFCSLTGMHLLPTTIRPRRNSAS